MNWSSAEIRQAQQQLQNQGFYHGQIDGIIGPETEQAVGPFQQKNGLSQTATLDQPTMGTLLGDPGSSQRSSAPTIPIGLIAPRSRCSRSLHGSRSRSEFPIRR